MLRRSTRPALRREMGSSSISRAVLPVPLAGQLLAQATYLCTLLTVVCSVFHDVVVLPGVSVFKVAGLLTFSFWLLWAAVEWGQPRRPWLVTRRNLMVGGSAVFTLCAIVMSALYALPSPLFLTSFLQMVLYFGLAVVVWSQLDSERSLTQACTCLAIAGTIAAALVIAQHLSPDTIGRVLGQHLSVEYYGIRATGPFRDPNYGSLSLIMVASLTAYSALAASRPAARAFLACCVAAQLAAVLLTFSRTGFLTLGVVTLVFLWRERDRLRRPTVLVTAAGIVLIAWFAMGGHVQDLVGERLGSLKEAVEIVRQGPSSVSVSDLSIANRYQALVGGWRMVMRRFPLGMGWENFQYTLSDYADSGVPNMGAHNMYMAVIAELGLPGLLASLAFLCLLYRNASLATRPLGMRSRELAEGVRTALTSGLVGSLFLGVTTEPVFWVLVGLILAETEIASGQRQP